MLFSILTVLLIILSYSITAYMWQNTYDKKNNNCKHMSYNLAKFFHTFGIPVKAVHGYRSNHSNSKAHCWLILFDTIEFESTSLSIHLFNDNDKFYNTSKAVVNKPWKAS